MGIIKTFKAISTLNKAAGFIEDNKSKVEQIKNGIEKLKRVIDFFKVNLVKAEAQLEKLKGIIKE